MPRVKSKSVKKDPKIVENEFLEDNEMFEDEEKFWEEMKVNKRKREKINDEEKKEVKEEKPEVKEQKPEVKKQRTSLYNKYKRKREGEEDSGKYRIYKRRSAPGYFQYSCEQLANNEKTLSEIFQEYLSIFTRHYKSLERIVYEGDRLKKRPVPEVIWIYGPLNKGEI
jgi:hypothetical protein